MQLQKALIFLLDELVFRPAFWLLTWKPRKSKHINEYWNEDPL
jgi:hypothetical protein